MSRAVNVVFFDGHENEMISSRAHREGWKLEKWLDAMFFWEENHSRASYEWEQERITPGDTNVA